MITASLVKDLREATSAGMMDCKKALEACNGNIEEATNWLREKGIAKASKKASRIAAEGLADSFIRDNKAVVIEVNSETDFVAKNDEFRSMINNIGNAILDSDVTTVEDALNVTCGEGTVNDLIVAKTSKIGEKLSLRRIAVVNKSDDEVFGSYSHNGGKIVTLVVAKGDNEAVAKDVAMQAAAMRPMYTFVSEVEESVLDKEREIFKEQSINEGKTPEIAEKMVEGRIKKYLKEIVLVKQEFIKDGSVDIETYLKNNNSELVSMIRYEVGEGMEKRNDNFVDEVMNQIKEA